MSTPDEAHAQCVALELVDELLLAAMEAVSDRALGAAAVTQGVLDATLQIAKAVDLYFLEPDPGEVAPWRPDEEPRAAVLDTWSRGGA